MTSTTLTAVRASFFSSLLSPSLLSLSPLQTILSCLHDVELVDFCCVNRDHHSILPRMRMSEYHTLDVDDWTVIQHRQGPIMTSIQLNELIQLSSIPVGQRGLIRRVRFTTFGEGVIVRESMPPLLEVLSSNDDFTHGYDRSNLRSNQLPILPSTLKTLILGFRMDSDDEENGGTESVGSMISTILLGVENLTDLRISAEDPSLFGALPSSIVSLSLHMYNSQLPDIDGWPTNLRHLTIETDNECEVELHTIRPPSQIESLKLPGEWQYDYYDETLELVSQLTSLRRIEYGLGISSMNKSDIFYLIPRSVTHVTYNNRMSLDECAAAKVDSLPEGVEELKFVLNNDVVKRWPYKLRILEILGDKFAQDLSTLPDSVEEIILPTGYTRTVSKWPVQLKKVELSPQFFDVASIERLPSSVTHLTVSIFIARKLMATRTLPPHLRRLDLLGQPDQSKLFDLHQLPSSLYHLTFDTNHAEVIGEDADDGEEESKLFITAQRLTNIKEVDLEATAALLADPRMVDLDQTGDAEELIGFLPKPELSWSRDPKPESAAQLASDQLFYTEPEYSEATLTQYELDFQQPSFFSGAKVPPTPIEVIDRLTSASCESPVNGVSFKEVQTPPLILALTSALAAGKVVGPLALIECQCDYSRQTQTQTTSGWRDGVPYEETKPYPDMVGLTPIIPPDDPELMKSGLTFGSNKQTIKDMIRLLEAMPQSKITRLKIETPRELFDLQANSSSSSSVVAAVVPEGFAAFCVSISRMPTLRTIVFRRCYNFRDDVGLPMMKLLVRTLLSPGCKSIESLDFGDCELNENVEPIAELIRQTKTLKHLVLSHAKLKTAGISKVLQALAVNRSLVTINLAGNPSGVAGLNALRLVLRDNRSINITVCHQDFGAPGIEMLKKKRHARLKESNRVYSDGSISGWDVELL